MTSRFNK